MSAGRVPVRGCVSTAVLGFVLGLAVAGTVRAQPDAEAATALDLVAQRERDRAYERGIDPYGGPPPPFGSYTLRRETYPRWLWIQDPTGRLPLAGPYCPHAPFCGDPYPLYPGRLSHCPPFQRCW